MNRTKGAHELSEATPQPVPNLLRISVNLTCPARDKILVEGNLAPHKSAVGTKYNIDFKDNISSLKRFKLEGMLFSTNITFPKELVFNNCISVIFCIRA